MIHPVLQFNRDDGGVVTAGADDAAGCQPLQTARQRTPSGSKILLLSCIYDFSYRVLQCAHQSGAEVYVLGNAGAKTLGFSRYCKKMFFSDHTISGLYDEDLALEINWYIRELNIDWVLPGDAPSTRALIAIKHLVEARCFPSPGLPEFDLLNNKWEFYKLCGELGISSPETWLYPDVAALLRDLELGNLPLPCIAKPLSFDNGRAQIQLTALGFRREVRRIRYRPILVQRFVAGEDIGASVYAKRGEIYAFIAHRLADDIYRSFDDERIYADLAKIVSHFQLDGVYNFDMRLSPDGEIYYLECNPRFFLKIDLSMLAGLNFVFCGITPLEIPAPVPAGIEVRLPRAILRCLVRPWRLRIADVAMLSRFFSDPVPRVLERLRCA